MMLVSCQVAKSKYYTVLCFRLFDNFVRFNTVMRHYADMYHALVDYTVFYETAFVLDYIFR